MVDALLDFSGAQAGILAPDRQPIDLAGVTAEVASMFRSPAEHAGLHFRVDLPDEPVTALVDRAMWSTIVTNLLSNAVKYTPHGGIDIDLRADEATAVLTVTDTGLGIAPERTDQGLRPVPPRPAGHHRRRAPASGWPWSRTSSARTRAPST